jgi:hypothetical protein
VVNAREHSKDGRHAHHNVEVRYHESRCRARLRQRLSPPR